MKVTDIFDITDLGNFTPTIYQNNDNLCASWHEGTLEVISGYEEEVMGGYSVNYDVSKNNLKPSYRICVDDIWVDTNKVSFKNYLIFLLFSFCCSYYQDKEFGDVPEGVFDVMFDAIDVLYDSYNNGGDELWYELNVGSEKL